MRKLLFAIVPVSLLLLLATIAGPALAGGSSTGNRTDNLIGVDKSDKAVGRKSGLDPFAFGVSSPRDTATGQATGRRIEKPVQFVSPLTTATGQTTATLSGIVRCKHCTDPASRKSH